MWPRGKGWNRIARAVCLLAFGAALGPVAAGLAQAQSKELRLGVSDDLVASGVLKYILPRFTLKTQIRFNRSGPEPSADLDVLLIAAGTGPDLPDGFSPRGHRIMESRDGTVYVLYLRDPSTATGAQGKLALRFRDWLTSEIGTRTITAYQIDGVQAYTLPGEEAVEVAEVSGDGDQLAGEKLAYFHCGRCHVISERNKFGGIGSTPSFGALKTIPDWESRFVGFYTLNPHPSFTQVEDVTEPFDPAKPPHIAPVELTLEDVEAILAFVRTIPAKDLSGVVLDQ